MDFTPAAPLPDVSPTTEPETLQAKFLPALPGAAEPWELLWNTDPGVQYRVWESDNLSTWDPLPGYPRAADSQADSQLLDGQDPNKFYRVELIDEQAPRLRAAFPQTAPSR